MNRTNTLPPGANIVEWAGHVLWGVSILLGVAGALAATAGRNRPALRHGLWLGALLCVLGLPGLTGLVDGFGWRIASMRIALPAGLFAARGPRSALRPRENLSRGEETMTAASRETEPVAASRQSAALQERGAGGPAPALAGKSALRSDRADGRVLLPLAASVWGLGSLFLALRLAVGWRRLRRLAREAQAPPPDWRETELQRVRQALSLNSLPPIALCRQARVPMVVGLVRPRVVLPANLAAEMSGSELEQTLIHECAHVRRRDQWVLAVQRVALVIFWPHPLLHYLNRELERAREELCDNHVLAASPPTAYAETLLRLAQACLPAPEWGAGMAMFRQATQLERRIRRLVDRHRDRGLVLARWPRLGVALLMTLLAAGVSAVQVQLGAPGSKTAGYDVSQKIIDDELQREIRSYGDRISFIQMLEAEGTTLERYRQQVRERIIEKALRDKNLASHSASRRTASPGQAEIQPGAQPANEQPAGEVQQKVDELTRNWGRMKLVADADTWGEQIRELIHIGPPAVPALTALLDRTDADLPLRLLGFALRAIGDPRAVPALIHAIPRTLRPPASDYGFKLRDPDLQEFMSRYQLSGPEQRGYIALCRPVREVFTALQKLTGATWGEEEIFGVFLEGEGHQRDLRRQLYDRVARRWADWWEANWNRFVADPALAAVWLPPLALSGQAGLDRFPTGPNIKVTDSAANVPVGPVEKQGA